ncbi:Vacuolar_ATP synthase subunit C [Hexamita inflata]|uniref:V-type proton ATPase subunit C n=1 Tax=Hexamita inflata TaxID=28002 RepID=A0AA86PC20_9EUKA|nr:Vacuolar ATP synthase subunit C [Hexamita inflata]
MSINVSVLGSKQLNFTALQKALGKTQATPLKLPKIPPSSISSLLLLVDEYTKLQNSAASFVLRLEKALQEHLPSEFHKVGGKSIEDFFRTQAGEQFKQVALDQRKYQLEEAQQQFQKLVNDLHDADQQLQTYNKQNSGSLVTKSANFLIQNHQIYSEFLENMVVIVQKQNAKDFAALIDNNEEHNPFVPQSYQILEEDPLQYAIAVLYLKSKKSVASQLIRDQKHFIKEFEENYEGADEERLQALIKQKQSRTNALIQFGQAVKQEIFQMAYQIIVERTLAECQLRFGAQFQICLMVCGESNLKQMRQSIKDTMSVEEDEGMYDQDMEQDNAFLAVVLNTVIIGDIK